MTSTLRSPTSWVRGPGTQDATAAGAPSGAPLAGTAEGSMITRVQR